MFLSMFLGFVRLKGLEKIHHPSNCKVFILRKMHKVKISWEKYQKLLFAPYGRKVSNVLLQKQGLVSRGLPKPADLQEE